MENEKNIREGGFELICCSPYKDDPFGWYVRLVYKRTYKGEVEFIEIPKCEFPFMENKAIIDRDMDDLPKLRLSSFNDKIRLYPDKNGNCLYTHSLKEEKVKVGKDKIESLLGHKVEIVI